jgi:type VI secretion system secreted protein VgrG
MIDVFTMSSSALPDGTRVVGFRGNEGISRPYAFEVFLTIADEESQDFDLADAINAKATLTLDRQDGRPPFAFHGMFSEVSILHEMGGRALVRALLVPQLWRLSQTLHSRIFTDKTIPDILKDTLEDGGLTSDEFTFKLAGQYKPEEHVCQYQESHLDFISRWMEREGMYYYFEQGDRGEKLVISDNRSFQHELHEQKVRFYALTGNDVSAKEALHSFVCRHRSLPGSVRVKDYDYTKPTLNVGGGAPVSATGLGEISIHGDRFFSPDAGKRLAQLRAEELLAREVVFTGSGTAFFLRAGFTFSLEDHPRSKFDAKYLAAEVEHYGNQAASTAEMKRYTGLDSDEVYRVDVTAMPEKTQFRAERRAAWPRIYGTEHGVIDGEADSEYAQIDDHGRYAVRFAFDESDLKPGKASTWVRMLQPHGGGVEGWHFPLRKGTEVLFTFLGGDPDRPVIAGVVPNALTPSPVTRGNHTKNVIQTGGRNRLELEDKAGQQRITLSTPHANSYVRMGSPNLDHQMIIHTDGATLLDAGENWDVTVGRNLNERVEGTTTEVYVGEQNTTALGGRVEFFSKHETEVKGHFHSQHHAGHKDEIEGVAERVVKGTLIDTVTSTVSQDYGATTTKINGNWDQTITGLLTQTINGPTSHFKGDAHTTVTVGITSDTFIGLKNSNMLGTNISSSLGANLAFSYAMDFKLIAGGTKAEFGSAQDIRATGVTKTDCIVFQLTAAGAANLNSAAVIALTAPSITASCAITIIA